MRGCNLDHKDKQNYDAVVHIISKSVEDLLAKVPDSDGTIAYLSVIRCVVESFLNKQLPLTARIEKAWYAVFFFALLASLVTLPTRLKVRVQLCNPKCIHMY